MKVLELRSKSRFDQQSGLWSSAPLTNKQFEVALYLRSDNFPEQRSICAPEKVLAMLRFGSQSGTELHLSSILGVAL